MDSKLQTLLEAFARDAESPETNFNLGLRYEELGNTSSALTHYLKCAERTKDTLKSYECLIRISVCLGTQGERNFSQSHMLKNAIALAPHRAEAYFYLCKFYEADDKIYDCYMLSSIALSFCDNPDESPFNAYPDRYGYMGREGLLLYKAVSGMHWEKYEECVEIYQNLLSTTTSDRVREICSNNLKLVGV